MSPLYIVFIVLHLLPPIIVISIRLWAVNLSSALKFSIYIFAIIYGLIIYSNLLTEFYLDYQLNKFDLNSDGMFSGPEVTQGQQLAMQKVVSDTGRTFAPFTGFIFSGFISFVFYTGFKFVSFVKKSPNTAN